MSKRAIPLVDLALYREGNETDKKAFVRNLGNAFHEYGFVGVINHGIPEELVATFYAEAKSFFALDEAIKSKYEIKGLAGQRGYTSFGKEHAKQSDFGDLKEFFQIGQELDGQDVDRSEYPDNVFVAERPCLFIHRYRTVPAYLKGQEVCCFRQSPSTLIWKSIILPVRSIKAAASSEPFTTHLSSKNPRVPSGPSNTKTSI